MAAFKLRPKTPSQVIAKPFVRFASLESSGGIVMLISTVIALLLANSPLQQLYENILQVNFSFLLGSFKLSEPLLFWVNDGLMALFFLVVGLEIKREILEGELSSFKKSALPVMAALGGMIVPALIFAAINFGKPTVHGWGIPVATDIAFSLGVLTLLGKRIPLGLKAFVAALAIADDIGGVLVIALFYTSNISLNAVYFGLAITILLIIANRLGASHPAPYFILGGFLWLAFVASGIHATLAGVLLALLIPAHSRINTREFIDRQQLLIEKLKPSISKKALSHEEYQATMNELGELTKQLETPMHRLSRLLLPTVTFFVVPVFALANAGVNITGNISSFATSPITIGVLLGLFFGKQLGIFTFTFLAVKSGLGALPGSVTWKHIYGAGIVCGIGFTVAMFLANISYTDSDLITQAKMGILAASLISGIAGYLFLKLTSRGNL